MMFSYADIVLQYDVGAIECTTTAVFSYEGALLPEAADVGAISLCSGISKVRILTYDGTEADSPAGTSDE